MNAIIHDDISTENVALPDKVKCDHMPIPLISSDRENRILSKIIKRDDGIWEWIGRKDKHHRVRITILGNRVPFNLNRVMWVIHKRLTVPDYQIPDHLFVCHKNDVTPELYDCNPENYFLGTAADNMRDRDCKGRQAKGDTSGPRLHPERMRRGDNHPARLHPECMARGDRNGSRTKPEKRPRGDGHWARLKPEILRRGNNHGMRLHPPKLTMDKANEIRALYATGEFSLTELGKRFGVAFQTISDINRNKRWAVNKSER